MSEREAIEISSELLFLTEKWFWADCFAEYIKLYTVPHIFETPSECRTIVDETEFAVWYAQVRTYYHENGVTDIARDIVSADCIDPVTIGATLVSRHLRECGTPDHAPYPCYWVIKNIGGKWRIASSTYAILDNPSLSDVLAAG